MSNQYSFPIYLFPMEEKSLDLNIVNNQKIYTKIEQLHNSLKSNFLQKKLLQSQLFVPNIQGTVKEIENLKHQLEQIKSRLNPDQQQRNLISLKNQLISQIKRKKESIQACKKMLSQSSLLKQQLYTGIEQLQLIFKSINHQEEQQTMITHINYQMPYREIENTKSIREKLMVDSIRKKPKKSSKNSKNLSQMKWRKMQELNQNMKKLQIESLMELIIQKKSGSISKSMFKNYKIDAYFDIKISQKAVLSQLEKISKINS